MKYTINKIKRTVELDDNIVHEFSKYDELRDSIFTIVLRAKYKERLTSNIISDSELSLTCNEILIDELKAIATIPAALETYSKNISEFKKAANNKQCIEESVTNL